MNKKYRLILLLLLILVTPGICYAGTINYTDDITHPPRVNKKYPIYITTSDGAVPVVTINDKEHFDIYKKKYIVIKKLPTDGNQDLFVFTNKNNYSEGVFSLYYKNIGFFIDKNKDIKQVSIKVTVNEVEQEIYTAGDINNISVNRIFQFAGWGIFSTYSQQVNKNDDNISLGTHMKMTLKVLTEDGDDLPSYIANDMYVPWYMQDIDIVSKSKGGKYKESIQFDDGFSDMFYLYGKGDDKTLLITTESPNGYMKFISTKATGSGEQPPPIYSTVVAYQVQPEAVVEWWGRGCGTAYKLAFSTGYPELQSSTKSSDKLTYAVGEKVSYTIKQVFPVITSANAPKRIRVIDNFDSALDIRNIQYRVTDSNGNNDSNNWQLSKEGNRAILTYSGNNFLNVAGNYTFEFYNIVVTAPDSATHRTVLGKDIAE